MASQSNRYVLGPKIAAGGMAEIYLGKVVGADGFSRIAAFKRVLPHFVSDQQFMEMFYNEAMLSKQLQNKNIVQIFDFVKHEDTYMIVMEYIDGADLRGVLQTASEQSLLFPMELACYIIVEVLNGLSYAHQAKEVNGRDLNIIHRDISPQNILISYEGDVKVTDFGIAKAANQSNATQAGVVKGKFRYMSPEQASGKAIDKRSDIFAVGIVLYEILAGRKLFNGEHELEIIESVRRCQIPPLSKVSPHKIDPQLEQIVMTFLKKDPQERFQSARDASRVLNQYLYKIKPDFFSGELSDLMHKLFSQRIEQARKMIKDVFNLKLSPSSTSSSSGESKKHQSSEEIELNLSEVDNAPKLAVQNPRSSPSSLSSGGSHHHGHQTNLTHLKYLPKTQSLGTTYGGSRVGTRYSSASSTRVSHAPSSFWLVLLVIPLVFIFWIFTKQSMTSRFDVIPNHKIHVKLNGKLVTPREGVIPPLNIKLPIGENQIEFSSFGYQTKKMEIKVSRLKALLGERIQQSLQLTPAGDLVSVRVVTDPPGATVQIHEDYPSFVTPGVKDNVLLNQSYDLDIRHPKCPPFSTKVMIQKDPRSRLVNLRYSLPKCR